MLKDNQTLFVHIEPPKFPNESVIIRFRLEEKIRGVPKQGAPLNNLLSLLSNGYCEYKFSTERNFTDHSQFMDAKLEYVLFGILTELQHTLAHSIWLAYNGTPYKGQ